MSGDLALCVNDTACPYFGTCPVVRGTIYTVAGLVPLMRSFSALFGDYGGAFALELEGVQAPAPLDPRRFRKIRDHTPDAEDTETIRLLTGKPARVPADAKVVALPIARRA